MNKLIPEIPSSKSLSVTDINRRSHLMSNSSRFEGMLDDGVSSAGIPENVMPEIVEMIKKYSTPALRFDGVDTKKGFCRLSAIEYCYGMSFEQLQIRSLRSVLASVRCKVRKGDVISVIRTFTDYLVDTLYVGEPMLIKDVENYIDPQDLDVFNRYIKGRSLEWFPLCLFHYEDLDNFYRFKVEKDDVGTSYIKSSKSMFMKFITECINHDIMHKNATAMMGLIKPKVYVKKNKEQKEDKEPLSKKQMITLTKAIMKSSKFSYSTKVKTVAYCWLTLSSYSRPSELANLKLSDINNEDIYIYQSKTGKGRTAIGANTGIAREMLKNWLAVREELLKKQNIESEYVFITTLNRYDNVSPKPIWGGWIKKKLNNIKKEFSDEIDFPTNAYMFRKSAITNALEGGAAMELVAFMAGHSSPDITNNFYNLQKHNQATRSVSEHLKKLRS